MFTVDLFAGHITLLNHLMYISLSVVASLIILHLSGATKKGTGM